MLEILNNKNLSGTRFFKVLIVLFSEIPSYLSYGLLPTSNSEKIDEVSVSELRSCVASVRCRNGKNGNQSSLRLKERILQNVLGRSRDATARKEQGISRIVERIDFQFLMKLLYIPTISENHAFNFSAIENKYFSNGKYETII